MSTTESPLRRMRADDRRAAVLDAAAQVFGRQGYTGTTTDQVARAAGISQPYVVRMFGGKEALFQEVLARAEQQVLAEFRHTLAERAPGVPVEGALGDAYVAMIEDSGIHQPLMQGFLLGADPAIGPQARQGFLRIWRFLIDEAGMSPEHALDFLGRGMLINVLLGLDLPAQTDPDARQLVDLACGPKADFLQSAGEV